MTPEEKATQLIDLFDNIPNVVLKGFKDPIRLSIAKCGAEIFCRGMIENVMYIDSENREQYLKYWKDVLNCLGDFNAKVGKTAKCEFSTLMYVEKK